MKINWFNWKGIAKPKLSIGDADTEISKKLIESKPHCQISNLPKDVFDLIVNYVQKYSYYIYILNSVNFLFKFLLISYFTSFDTKREELLVAYNPKCTFSLSINMGSNQSAHRPFKFDEFLTRENRNLKRIYGNDGNLK